MMHKPGRLRHQLDFDYVRNHGHKFVGRITVVRWVVAPDDHTRLGMAVGKSFHRHAVKRNRARRCIREAFRLLRPSFVPSIWLIVIPRHRLLQARMPDVRRDLSALLRQVNPS